MSKIEIKRYIKTFFLMMFVLLLCISPENIIASEIQSSGVMGQGSAMHNPVKKTAGVEMVLVSCGRIADFWISRFEVTQELYESVMKTNPSYFKGRRLPVEQVSWFNAVEFCNKLSVMAGLDPYYIINKKIDASENSTGVIKRIVTVNKEAGGFRLPTSEEWESAARGGSKKKYFWGDMINGDYCWYGDNAGKSTHPVGTKKPNNFGIFDITGNVREWCFDWHPSFPDLYRVVRDGHYSLDAMEMELDKTDYRAPDLEFGFTGIRLVKNK